MVSLTQPVHNMTSKAGNFEHLPTLSNRVGTINELEEWNAFAFWSGYNSWLAAHGYVLYGLREDDSGNLQWLPPQSNAAIPPTLPYSAYFRDPHRKSDEKCSTRIIGYAQDAIKRDVVIKLVDEDSEELAIYSCLLNCCELFNPHTFACVLPPVEILHSPDNFCFVVMPRWGGYVWVPSRKTVWEVVNCVKCIIQGLEFLHLHRIAHRDISVGNILQNFYDYNPYEEVSCLRVALHRKSSEAQYCLFDFNISRIFPRHATIQECRLPASESDDWGAPWHHPMDVRQGEFDYDPFAFDVGCLGNMLLDLFGHALPAIPCLIPLLDRMTTHIIAERFTAAEASKFCNAILDSIPDSELDALVPENKREIVVLADCWDKLSQDFVSVWAMYRSPAVSWTTHLLRWACGYYPVLRMVRLIRRTLRI